jgi:class 3 adenylate cyclase
MRWPRLCAVCACDLTFVAAAPGQVGYTAMCDRMHNPAKVMVVLDLMYQAFDTMAEMTGAYKVETIGDAYFAVTGLCLTSTRGTPASQSEEESCYRMVLFARCVREFMLGPFGRSYGIRMRIGLHTGDVVTGVLGELRPRMVVVGDTVNVASRMETAAEANSINLSYTSADLLREHFELQARNPEEIKGKGVFQMYELGEPKFTYCPFGLPTPEHIVECAYRGLRECKERAEIDNQSLDQYCSPELTTHLSGASLGTPLSRPFRTSYRAFPYGLVAE